MEELTRAAQSYDMHEGPNSWRIRLDLAAVSQKTQIYKFTNFWLYTFGLISMTAPKVVVPDQVGM